MSYTPSEAAPTADDVLAALPRIRDWVVDTPLIRPSILKAHTGGDIFLKLETLQHTGSFKIRGVSNRLLKLSEAEKRRGVVAWSSGNHAGAIAYAARLQGIDAAIVMPADAPAEKLKRARREGAEVVLYDRNSESREEIAMALAEERGAILVPSYDAPDIIAGQGTAGLEIADTAIAQGVSLDALLVCCGGGGLTAGCALAMEARSPGTAVYAVEPAEYDDHAQSLAKGVRTPASPQAPSICDALLAPVPGHLTFAINKPRLSGALSVTDEDVRETVSYAARELKLILEPGGAVALAAVMTGKIDVQGKAVAVMASGANIDADLLSECLASYPAPFATSN